MRQGFGRRGWWIAAVLGGWSLIMGSAAAADQKLGGMFAIGEIEKGNSLCGPVAVARQASGDFVATWCRLIDGQASRVYLRRFRADGLPLSGETAVHPSSDNYQGAPSIGMNHDGGFAIAWRASGVHVRAFGADGTPVGAQVLVNTKPVRSGAAPLVGMAADGGFVVTWQADSGAVKGRRYDAAANPVTAELTLNQAPQVWANEPRSLAVAPDGRFTVVWSSRPTGGPVTNFATFFDASNAPLAEVQLDETTTPVYYYERPRALYDSAGNVRIAWTDGQKLVMRRYSSSGTVLGPEQLLTTRSEIDGPVIALDARDAMTAAWRKSTIVEVQRFAADGTALTSPARVDPAGSRDAYTAWVASDADGDYVVAWTVDGGGSGTTRAYPKAQRFVGPEPVDLRLRAVPENLLVQPGATFTSTITVTNQHAVADDAAIGAATGVQLEVPLPTGAVVQSTTGEGWTCEGGTPLVCVLATPLAAGAKSTVSVTALAPAQACRVAIPATVTADQQDPNAGDNTVDRSFMVNLAGTLQFDRGSLAFDEGGSAFVQVRRVGGCAGAASVNVATVDGTAVADADYTPVDRLLEWNDGNQSPRTIQIVTRDTRVAEAPEDFTVRLVGAAGAALGEPSTIDVSILDHDFAAIVVTPSGGSTRVTESFADDDYTIVLTSKPLADVDVAIAAPAGLRVSPRTARFSPQNWSAPRTITVSAPDNTAIGPDRSLEIVHTATSADPSYDGAPVDGVPVTRIEDDSQITLSTERISRTEDSAWILVPVSRKGASLGAVSVTVSTADDSAVSGLDYTGIQQTLSWADGEAGERYVQIALVDDGTYESRESFTVNLGVPTSDGGHVAIGKIATTRILVSDDDPAPP